jgi:catechol 2,3-dioxygenase-like lactoylglutathione lyase family enzyme
MIRKMSHATIFVNNQNEALEFYRDKLGFKVHTDAMVGEDFRWLTMCTNDQPDFEIILFEPKPGMMMERSTRGGRFQHRRLPRNLRRTQSKRRPVSFTAIRTALRNRSRFQRQFRQLVQSHAATVE